MRKRPLADRFLEKVSPEPTTGCWLWLGCIGRTGYGKVGVEGACKSAHRVSWLLAFGYMPPASVDLDHRCGVRSCVNPSHLEAVSHLENVRRGKRANMSGSRNPRAKLTESDVLAIRHDPRHPSAIASERGMNPRHISRVKRGRSWRRLGVA